MLLLLVGDEKQGTIIIMFSCICDTGHNTGKEFVFAEIICGGGDMTAPLAYTENK